MCTILPSSLFNLFHADVREADAEASQIYPPIFVTNDVSISLSHKGLSSTSSTLSLCPLVTSWAVIREPEEGGRGEERVVRRWPGAVIEAGAHFGETKDDSS